MNARFRALALALACIALAAGSVACGPDYDRTEFSSIVVDPFSPAGSESINVRSLTVHEGMILKSHIVSWNDDNVQMSLTVTSEDANTVEIVKVVGSHEYAFIGKKVGHTKIQFVADDKLRLVVEADVLAQPSPP